MSSDFTLSCVLFDLDGTLVDTAPDLIACLNKALQEQGIDAVSMDEIKPFISDGAAAIIARVVDDTDQLTQEKILQSMLSFYLKNTAEHSQFFSGIVETLQTIESLGLKWGIVTNKRACFTDPLVEALGLTNRAACIISSDTTAYMKPHPEPLLTACRLAHVKPEECVYIGDALKDIQAGKNAKMKTLAVLYGYLKPNDNPKDWGADEILSSAPEITSWIVNTCHH